MSEEPVSEEVANEQKASAKPQAGAPHPALSLPTNLDSEAWDPSSVACSDPCYIANLTDRQEQYREFALKDLAAGRDPRAWEDFIPGKSRSRRPAPIPSLHS